MASTVTNPTVPGIVSLLGKIGDPDPDFRFMSLQDLLDVLTNCRPEFLASNHTLALRCLDEIIKTLDDTNGEVQGVAMKCLAPLSQKLPPACFTPLLEKLSTLKLVNSIDTTMPAHSLRACILNMPRPEAGVPTTTHVAAAYDAIVTVLVPRLLSPATEYKNVTSISVVGTASWNAKMVIPESVNVLIEIVRCFGPLLSDKIISWMQQAMSMLLDSDASSSAVKKSAVVAISVLSPNLSDPALKAMFDGIAQRLSHPNLGSAARRHYMTILGSTARSIPVRFGRHVSKLAPLVLKPLGEEELQALRAQVEEGTAQLEKFDEVREAALVTLEAFLASCPTEMVPFTNDTMQSALRYLRYDPNSTVDDDEEEDEEDEEEEDDDASEEDFGFDDDDDTSWKVRRCAAKVMASVITTRSHDLLEEGVLYRDAAPALVRRFSERQENVRLEVIAALAQLVRKTGDGRSLLLEEFDLEAPSLLNRKRRRQSSGGAGSFDPGLMSPVAEPVPMSGPRADLDRLTPAIIKQSHKLLMGKTIPTKQAVIRLLDDIVCAQRGGVGDALGSLMDLLVETIRSPGGSSSAAASALTAVSGNATATPNTLRMAGLKLVADVAKTHSSSLLTDSVPKIVDVVVASTVDRFYKVSSEAIRTSQELVKAITPPRCRAGSGQAFKPELAKLYEAIMGRITSSDADLEVRQRAIQALATLVARTSALDSSWLPAEKKAVALATVLDRLRNETTRLAAVCAVDTILASPGNLQFGPQWTREVAQELASQMRKANRTLKVSSIQALRRLLTTPTTKAQLDGDGARAIIPSLLPAISEADPQVLGPALNILGSLALDYPELVVEDHVLSALCALLMSSSAAIALDQILGVVNNVGSTGSGQALMTVLLRDVSIRGDANVVGKVIGALVVSSGSSSSVTAQSFVTELASSSQQGDEQRVALALAVLGEIGMRLGHESPLDPSLFLAQFHDEPNKVSVAAATALGRAGSADIGQFLPVILSKMREGGTMQYLSILATKEILYKVADLNEFATQVWDHLLQASVNPESKVVCAECVGRLIIMNPSLFMPQLQALLVHDLPGVRAMAVQAVRYSLAETDELFDRMLRTLLVKMLETMQRDPELEIRRLAMTTLNSAVHNKPDILLPSLPTFMPFVFAHTVINRDLIREVKLGPFTHIVDDGLELRKSAYDTLYALMETAFSRMPIKEFYDRVIAGLSDDNDIRGVCNLMITKLITLSPDETLARLDVIAECYRKTLQTKLKEHAVKQDLEKQEEASKGVLRVTLLVTDRLAAMHPSSTLAAAAGGGGGGGGSHSNALREWENFWDWVSKDHDTQIKKLREESRSLQTASM